jgi:hypothetical protein
MHSELFESWHVTEWLVGIPPTYLNMFLQRKLYGITASISGRRGDKSSRRFDEATVFGIALVWMLFTSGLRTESIRRVLNDITEATDADAVAAADFLLQAQVHYLVVIRELGIHGDEPGADFKTAGTSYEEDIAKFVSDNPKASVLTVPIGEKFGAIEQRMSVIKEAKTNVPPQTR